MFRLFPLAAPALVVVGLVGALQRPSVERLQALPIVLIGSGLTLAAYGQWSLYRRRLLRILRQRQADRIEAFGPVEHDARPGDTAE